MAHDHRVPIVVTPFRTMPSVDGRTRSIFLTENRRGRAVTIETYAKDGRQIGGTFLLFPDDLPAFLAALTEAAAAIGVELPGRPAPRSGTSTPDRHLTRARAM